MRRLFVSMSALVAALIPAPQASAAVFMETPPAHSTSGPYAFAMQSTGTGGSSALAYKLPNEPYWHRCGVPNAVRVTIDSLPPGTYDVLIADDVNVNYYASIGQLYSGITAPCSQSPPPDPAPSGLARYRFTVDTPAEPAPPARPAESAPAPAPIVPTASIPPTQDVRTDCYREEKKLAAMRRRSDRAKRAYQRRRTFGRWRSWRKARGAYLAQRRLYLNHC